MSDYYIEKSNFEEQKQKLKRFAEESVINTELNEFSTSNDLNDFLHGGLIGGFFGKHTVTGEELNNLITALQNCFKEINDNNRKVIKEFGEIYETFDILDKEYIQGILMGVKSAEKASQEARMAQKDADDIIESLQKTVNKLKEFKTEINGYEHLKDIDTIWSDSLQLCEDTKELSQKLKTQEYDLVKKTAELRQSVVKIENLEMASKSLEILFQKLTVQIGQIEVFKNDLEKSNHINDIDLMWDDIQRIEKNTVALIKGIKSSAEELSGRVQELADFNANLYEYKHLMDIDSMWDDVKSFHHITSELSNNLEQNISKLEKELSKIQEFRESQKHFSDTDVMWDKLQSCESTLSKYAILQKKLDEDLAQINTFISRFKTMQHINDIDSEWDYVHSLAESHEKTVSRITDIEAKISDYELNLQSFQSENLQLKQRLNMAYIVAGVAMGISIIQIILLAIGVL